MSGTRTCLDDISHLIISTQGYSEYECRKHASMYNHTMVRFYFWSSVYKTNENLKKSRCDLFKQCNLTRTNDFPGDTYKLENTGSCKQGRNGILLINIITNCFQPFSVNINAR